jgi:hypothetical protein
MKYKLLTLIFFIIVTACVDTHKEIVVSEVSIETLKKMLINNKCHNKAIFIFNPDCSTCMFYLKEEYSIMQSKFLDSIDYIFISVDTIPLKEYKDFFRTIGIKNGHLFSLCESNPDYLLSNRRINFTNITKYLFSNEENVRILGFPVSAMANKENKIKLEYYLMSDRSSIIIRPQPWHRLYLSSLYEIDFNIIDNFNH